jgi:hypothetical protein
MRDTEFYEALLGLRGPWRVSKVELDSSAGRVDVWVEDRSDIYRRSRIGCCEIRRRH